MSPADWLCVHVAFRLQSINHCSADGEIDDVYLSVDDLLEKKVEMKED